VLPAEAYPLLAGVADARVLVADFFDRFVWHPRQPDAVRLSAGDFLQAFEDAPAQAALEASKKG
jgi:hypothetical protein